MNLEGILAQLTAMLVALVLAAGMSPEATQTSRPVLPTGRHVICRRSMRSRMARGEIPSRRAASAMLTQLPATSPGPSRDSPGLSQPCGCMRCSPDKRLRYSDSTNRSGPASRWALSRATPPRVVATLGFMK